MSEPFFDRLSPKYNCCCGFLHVEVGTKIICGFALITYLFSAIMFFAKGPGEFTGNWDILRIIIGSLMVAGPLVGLQKTRPTYFLPYLVYLVSFL